MMYLVFGLGWSPELVCGAFVLVGVSVELLFLERWEC